MDDREWLAQRFDQDRSRLRAAAYRMLGSTSEADDAVQEAWLRLDRSDADGVENLSAWLTTVVARVSLNMLRSRRGRRERSLEEVADSPSAGGAPDPEQEAVLGDSVGLALLVVLDTLTPAERLAFVLHDMFDLTFDEIAPVVGRSSSATRQLASRARRRVRGTTTAVPDPDRQRRLVEAYLNAARQGDFAALMNVLDPDVVLRTDAQTGPKGRPTEFRGASSVAHGATTAAAAARHADLAWIDGAVGLALVRRGRLVVVLSFAVAGDRVTSIDVIGERERLGRLHVTVLGESPGPAPRA